MKNRIVSFLIANILVITSIGFSTMDIKYAYALEPEDGTGFEDAVEDEDVEEDEEYFEDSYSFDVPEDVKVIGFGELPEEVSYQEVKSGTTIDEIIFPDTLQIDVVPDPDREERLTKQLGEERKNSKKASDELEEELEEEETDEASDEASLGESSETDEEEIIFFDSETGESEIGHIDDEVPYYVPEEDNNGYDNWDNSSNASDNQNTQSYQENNDAGNSNSASDEPENTDEEIIFEIPAETEETQEAPENSDDGDSGDLIGFFKSVFKPLTVHAAEDSEDETEPDADDSDVEKELDADDFEDEDGISHEMVSDVKWIVDYDENGIDTYDPDLVGMEYVFVPVMLLPDFYYIEADLPTITVKIVEEKFAFDETVEVDGVKIRVRAGEGVFPEGSTIFAEKLEEEDEEEVDEMVSKSASEADEATGIVVKTYSFDIQIQDEEGKEIEPDTEKGSVIVSFETEEAEDDELSAHVYHIIEDEDENKEVEQLTAVVVDGEETKTVEAVTESFSKYTLRFTWDNIDFTWPSEKNYVCLDYIFKQKGYLGTGTNLIIDDPATDITYTGDANQYFYFARLANTTEAGTGFAPVINPATGCYVDVNDSTYTSYNNAKWFIIMRKPFVGATAPKEVSFTCNRDGSVGTVNLKITNTEKTGATLIHQYPQGQAPGTNNFVLEMDVGVDSTSDISGVTFQWQYRKNSTSDWINIDLANSDVFGGNFTTTSGYAAGDWFRCIVSGTESSEVQIITANSDGTARTWTSSYHGNDTCYVSNGKVAYTVDTVVTSGTITDCIIDVVGEFAKNGKAYMVQTSRGSAGWDLVSSIYEAPTTGTLADNCALDNLYFTFDASNPQELLVEADLASTEQSFAVGTSCAIGSTTIPDIVPETGTLIGSQDSNYYISRVSYIGIAGRDEAQDAMNKGKGTDYPAVSVIPVTTKSLRTYIGSTGVPYAFASGGSSTVRVDGDGTFSNVSLLKERVNAGVAVSWIKAAAGSTVSFKFAVGSLATVTTLKNIKDATYTGSVNTTNIKDAKLVGDELKKYAITVANPTDSVLETMKFSSPSSVHSSLSTKATGSSTTKSSTTSTTSSTSTTTYKADYLDMTINQTSDNSTYNNKTVSVVRTNSKDSSSAEMPLKIELSYDFGDKSGIKVYRYHDGTVKEFTEATTGADGTFTINKDAGKIYIYSSKFSQFAVAYKADVYYNVTFDDGTSKNVVKVKAGEKVSRPNDPTKEGYTFKGWYLKGAVSSTSSTTTSSTSSTSSSATSAVAFNFDTAINRDITLVAGWTVSKDPSKNGGDSDNDSRAPKTGDNLPIVWLWVIILAAGMVTFALSLRELINAKKPVNEPKQPPKGLKKALLLMGIIITTTAKFIARKIKENKAKALLTASGAVVVVSVIVLATTMFQYKKAEDLYIGAEETYVEESAEGVSTGQQEDIAAEPHNWWDCVDVNVGELSKKYPDVVGWLYFENEDISYPIMFSGDNSKYLDTAYTGEKARAGAIFIDGESTPDFSDPHSLVYGHNMRDLSMFGKLRYYRNHPDYYEDHQYFQVFTKDSVYRYRIFACEVVPDNHDVFWVFGKEPEDYWKMLKEVESDSLIKTDIKANESDHVITLATCTNNDEERFIVCAVRTDAYQYQQ